MGNAYDCDVVIDLEFTPVPGGAGQGRPAAEIIEVGAVMLAPDGSVAGEFSRMVRPTFAHGPSHEVRMLTGIRGRDLACAATLDEALAALAAWIGPRRARMVAWSASDRRQVERECAAKGVADPLPGRWLDAQRLYPRLAGVRRRRKVALTEAAAWVGADGDCAPAHRALADARATAEVFLAMRTGELASSRDRVRAEVRRTPEPLGSSLSERCAGLAGLLERLRAEEAA